MYYVELQTMANNTSNDFTLVERFKSFYRDLMAVRLDDMGLLYDTNVVFRDPVHEIRGVHDLHAYMSTMCNGITQGRFEYIDQLVAEGRAYVKWNMYYAHPRLGRQTIVVRGVSQVEFAEKIFYHEDIYDMGELLYEHVPVLGGATRWLKKRIANGARQ